MTLAIENDDAQALQVLLENGVHPNVRFWGDEHTGWTPLMWAARNSKINAMKVLIDNDANINALHWHVHTFYTPLLHAFKESQYEAVALLLSAGAKTEGLRYLADFLQRWDSMPPDLRNQIEHMPNDRWEQEDQHAALMALRWL